MSVSVKMIDITVSFYQKQVLKNINIDFLCSGITIVTGYSGSGKTTLLRSINRLNEEFDGCTTEGYIEANIGEGLEPIYPLLPKDYSLSMLRRRIGMVFQIPNVFPVSIYKNIALPLKQLTSANQREIAERVYFVLESVGLLREVQDQLHAPAIHLSGGQQQRLCLARMLALEPSIVLLDEPTTSLDTQAAQSIERLLLRLSENYSIIMVSHNISQISRLAQHLTIIGHCGMKYTRQNSSFTEKDIMMLLEEGYL